MSDRPSNAIGPKAAELASLYRDMMRALDAGHDREECLAMLEKGLRAAFPPVSDRDPRLWRRCYVCDDTGYEPLIRHPDIYGGTVPIHYVRPCTCEKGQAQQRAIDAASEAERQRRDKRKSTGWAR